MNTDSPFIPVNYKNMCIAQASCDGVTHPFERTLHFGDLIIIQGVDARSVEAAYPNSDVLVFHAPKQELAQEDALIITRAVAKEEINGTVYFRTKGDGTGTHKWPETPDVKECDHWSDYHENYTLNGMISEKLLVGRVVFRVPWIGYLVLFASGYSGLLIAAILIAAVVIMKLVVPKVRGKKTETKPERKIETTSET